MVVWQIRDMNKPDSGDVVFHDHTVSLFYSSHYVVGYYFTSVPTVIEKNWNERIQPYYSLKSFHQPLF